MVCGPVDVPEQAGHVLGLGDVDRQRLALGAGDEEPGVAGGRAELERLAQRVAVVRLEEADRDERLERGDRLRGVQRRVLRAVHELQQLHGELDVGQRAATELQVELRVLARRDALLLDAHLHPPDVLGRVVGERVAVDERLRRARRTAAPRSRSPAAGRALISAWNSHVSP